MDPLPRALAIWQANDQRDVMHSLVNRTRVVVVIVVLKQLFTVV